MSTFASSFWSSDYAAGLGVLFSKLQQGAQEDEQILTVARLRADAEDVYGQRLGEIETATNRITGGFQRDDGASLKKAYEGVRTEMGEASRNHRKIASNIRELVISPFSRWCDQHTARVQNSQDDLQGRIKAHDRQAETVRQYRSAYYNKCRRVEDLEEEEKLAFQDPSSVAATGSPKTAPVNVPSIKVEEDTDVEPIDIADETYQPERIKKILAHALEHIRLGEVKVPILGTYQNVSTGAEITEYIQKHMGGTSMAHAERIGQDLIGNGFLRLIGNMGSTFANSSRMNYQWRPKVFQLTGVPEKRFKLLGRGSTMTFGSESGATADTPVIGDRMSEMLGGWINTAHPNETPAEKLRREARESDERYKAAVKKLDGLRCSLEESMIDHLKFMERCELDRLKAVKSVVLDFSGAISNVIPSLQSTVDNMMLFQETVQPVGDLRYLLENYRTGSYCPKVVVYENYYNQVDDHSFGVDIDARAKGDRRRVPTIVTSILTFLDSHYPDLEGDEARRSIWVVDVPLAATHHLRNQINGISPIPQELLEKYEIPIVASVLKLYMLELPDSLVSAHVYEIIKTVYTTTSQTSSEATRIQVIQSTLGQLRLANIATLDALITHFTRLIDLTSADEAFVAQLASVLAPCIMRPKTETGLSMNEKYNVRLLRDLFAHKDAIFGELKRQSSLTHTTSGATRQTRAVSTDESKRREHMEERQRAIAAAQQAQAGGSRSRQPSPGPGTRIPEGSVRRERSPGPLTRFPVATQAVPDTRKVISPTNSNGSSNRDSLNVPLSPPATRQPQPPLQQQPTTSPPKPNGTLHRPPPQEPDEPATAPPISNRISMPPALSASIAGPMDFNTGHYYSASLDTAAPAASRHKSTHQVSSSEEISAPGAFPETAAETTTTMTPTKKDSLSRAGVRPGGGRKNTLSSLQRGSLYGRPESAGSFDFGVGGRGEEAAPGKLAVQLEDRPVDFD